MSRLSPRGACSVSLALALAVASFVTVAPARAQTTALAPVRHPNILWISTEDLSPRIGAYGDKVARTPTLDQLAREGMRFTNAFTTAPVCAPSRAAIITGMWQNAIGAQHMRTGENTVADLPGPYEAVPPFYVKAFPEYLRAAGYYTTNNVKTDYQFGSPFTIWDELSDKAHWRNRPDKRQPFFSVFNIMTTHESMVFPAVLKGRKPVTDPSQVVVPPYYPDTPKVREGLAQWYDNIAKMDGEVGALLRQLEEDGLADSTVVFFWSDHGDGLPRGKRSLYDSGLRSLLMVRWPKSMKPAFAPGSVNKQLVSLHRPGAHRALDRRRADPAAHAGARAVRPDGRARAALRLRRARPDGRRVRHDALGARRAISLHPQLPARAAVRRLHPIPQREPDHAGARADAGRGLPEGTGGPLDAALASAGRAVRRPGGSGSDPRSLGGSRASRRARADAPARWTSGWRASAIRG